MKHFRVGKNAQVVVYVVGNQLVTVVNFEGSARSMLFGRTYDGNYAHLNEENLLPDYHAFNEAEALLMASRAGEVEPLDEESEEVIGDEPEVRAVIMEKFSASANSVIHTDNTLVESSTPNTRDGVSIAPYEGAAPLVDPKRSETDSLEMSESQLIKK